IPELPALQSVSASSLSPSRGEHGETAMAKLRVQADQETANQIRRWMESVGPAKQEELAEMIDAADDRWSKLEWGRISDWIERNGGRRSYATWLVIEGAESRPKSPPLVSESGQLIEAGWLACRNASAMLQSMPWWAEGLRRRRLFACACARRLWEMLPDGW